MLNFRLIRFILSFIAVLGLMIPNAIINAGEQSDPKIRIRTHDMRLDQSGRLAGLIVDANNKPLKGVVIEVFQGKRPITKKKSDQEGKYLLELTRGGSYQLYVQDHLVSIRAWTKDAAPPTAKSRLAIFMPNVVRGQNVPIPYTSVNPWVVAGVVSAAVAIPVLIHNNRSDRPSGS